jgi:hypothetical protein
VDLPRLSNAARSQSDTASNQPSNYGEYSRHRWVRTGNFNAPALLPKSLLAFKLGLVEQLPRSPGKHKLLFCLSRIWKIAPFGLV